MTRNLVLTLIILLFIYFLIPDITKDEANLRKEDNKELRGIFVSYIELSNYIKGKTLEESKKNIDEIIKNTKNKKFNTLFLQVRSHMNSIYKSKYFPISTDIILNDNSSFDVLDYFIKKAKKNNIDIYAWVNPYRINKSVDPNTNYYSRVKNDIKLVGDT